MIKIRYKESKKFAFIYLNKRTIVGSVACDDVFYDVINKEVYLYFDDKKIAFFAPADFEVTK